MNRRTFIAGLGGAAAWPMVARAHQPDRMRRVGVLMGQAADDPEAQARVAAFVEGLQNWAGATAATCGSSIRWPAGDADLARRYAAELVRSRQMSF